MDSTMSWNPTHVVVAVQRAKDLISKGKNGTNDAFVTIALTENKFQTSIKDKVIDPEWYEECDVPLPDDYNKHKLILQVFHRNNLGIDEFLGHIEIPLQNIDVYDAPRALWHPLLCKPGQNKTKPRGEVEVRLSFEVKKVRDLDSMSVTSSASKRFKMRRKIKGPKVEKTADYVPDLNALDTGALSLEDIAENYSPVVLKKKHSGSDSMSLPPASPGMVRSSPRSSKGRSGYSPFDKRRSRGDIETPPSSNASMEDMKQRADDADSHDGFVRGHRRGGSGSDVASNKPNRRLLTSRPKSSSTVDISAASNTEFAMVGDRSSMVLDDPVAKSRIRTSTSTSQISGEVLPELEEDSKDGSAIDNKGNSSAAAKIPSEPLLIDDEDSDGSLENYQPAPIVPLVRKEEPAGLFDRLNEQMEQEKADQFNLAVHQAQPGEDIFTPVAKLVPPPADTVANSTIQVDDVIAHSTPKHEEPQAEIPAKRKHKHKSKDKKKVAAPASDLFNLLMASDEPEYNVDATLSYRDRNKAPTGDFESIDFSAKKEESKVKEPGNPFNKEETNPFEVSASLANAENKVAEHVNDTPSVDQSASASNPFEDEPEKPSNPFDEPNPFTEVTKPAGNSNPFTEATESATKANPFDEPSNPFGEPSPTHNDANPFEEASPVAKNSSEKTDAKKDDIKPVNNPFEEDDDDTAGGLNPFEGDDDDTPADFKRVGSFARAGSSRFKGSNQQKKREKKAAAPPPPKPQRLFSESQASETITTNIGGAQAQKDAGSPVASKPESSDSPKQKSKKEKKAPKAPQVSAITASETSAGRVRSSSYNPSPTQPASAGGMSKRRSTDISKMEQVINSKDRPPFTSHSRSGSGGNVASGIGKSERQPAIGAESPEVLTEPKVTMDISTQVTMDAPESVPSEFRYMSKMDLVEMIQKLRIQVRKKDEHAKDLEEYIDSLLLRVMSNDPNLLSAQNTCSQQANHANKLR